MRSVTALMSLLVVTAALATGSARAQQLSSEYILSPGDIIEISILNHNEMDRTLTVLPDGNIALPAVGEVKAAGKTPKSLGEELRKNLEKTLNNFAVTVTVKMPRPRKVHIIGAIKSSGAYDFLDGARLIDLVAAGGGITAKPELVTGQIIRGKSKIVQLDIVGAFQKPESNANAALELDDIVVINQLETPPTPYVAVNGSVVKPGPVVFDASTSILTMLGAAGGGTQRASYSRAYVVRGTQKMPLNLLPLMVKGEPDPKVSQFKLEKDDILFIPENTQQFGVFGAVTHNGFKPLSEVGPVTVLDALNVAIPISQGSDMSKSTLVRVKDGKPVSIPLNIEQLLKKADISVNLTLQDGDILYVPHKGEKGLRWLDLISPLSLIGLRFVR